MSFSREISNPSIMMSGVFRDACTPISISSRLEPRDALPRMLRDGRLLGSLPARLFTATLSTGSMFFRVTIRFCPLKFRSSFSEMEVTAPVKVSLFLLKIPVTTTSSSILSGSILATIPLMSFMTFRRYGLKPIYEISISPGSFMIREKLPSTSASEELEVPLT